MQLQSKKKKFDPRWPLIIITCIGIFVFGCIKHITTDWTTEEDRILDKEIREFTSSDLNKCDAHIWITDHCNYGYNNNFCKKRSLSSSEYRNFRLWRCRKNKE